MALKSMTGFGKAANEIPGKKITVEIRSLNSKQLDLNVRMPYYYKEKELELRTDIAKLLERGNHPAALAASEYSADGRKDFYLPSHRELLQVVAVEGFNDDDEYTWTSTPSGSYGAWAVSFAYGSVRGWSRSSEFRVRPVRSIIA